MFSYFINNPQNFLIQNTDFYAIPFGHRCTSAIICKYANIRKFSLPFDWIIPLLPNKTKQILENDFQDFIPNVPYNYFNKYNVGLAHFNKDIEEGIQEYKRRIQRFNEIINKKNKKLYFIYINEDYLYNKDYREREFNDNIFNEMLDLELFLKEKYPHIDYNILYFNFQEHNIPSNSNIINIVLNTTNLYDFEYENMSETYYFRIYCGEILSKLFNTELIPGHDDNIFIN